MSNRIKIEREKIIKKRVMVKTSKGENYTIIITT